MPAISCLKTLHKSLLNRGHLMSLIGRMVSHYRILEKIGSGGMGTVYKAKDTKLDRLVALKFLPPHLSQTEEEKKRFIHEAKAASALDHLNICSIYEINQTEDGQMFIAMACYEGGSLKSRIRKGPLPMEEALAIADQIARGLEKAHQKGIVHRDIKPANILITEDGVVKIVDFGLASMAGVTKLTKTGTTLGTASYMSPEQTRGESVDNRSDIWSLGVVLYEMMTGRLPFRGDYGQAVIYSIMNEDPEPVSKLRPEIPESLEQVVFRALEKDPDKRYQHMDELLDDLKSISAGIVPDEIQIRLKKTKRQKTKKIWLYAGIACVILAVSAITLRRFLTPRPAAPVIENSLAVISFENLTGESSQDVLQRIIPNLLITNLENTGFFHVVTWDRLRDLMKQMGKKNEGFITRRTGFELCRREGIEKVAMGSVMKVGDVIATEVKVYDARSEKLIRTSRSQGEGINSIINTQVDELSREIALGAGVTREQLASADLDISEFTTTSLEAYNYFIKGRENFYDQYIKDAITTLEKAVEIDPDFAMAYLYLGYTYGNLAMDLKKAIAYYTKAKALSQAVSEKERLLIEAAYAETVEGSTEKWLEIMNTVAEKYPREIQAHVELSEYYRHREMSSEVIRHAEVILALDPTRGDAYEELAFAYANTGYDEKALEYLERGSAAIPGDPRMNLTAGQFYVKMGKIDDAIKKFKDALDIKPDFTIENFLAYAYAMKEDYDEAFRWCKKYSENPISGGLEAKGYWFSGFYHHWLGNYEQAVEDLQKAWQIVYETGNRDFMSEFLLGYFYYKKGDWDLSRDYIQGWHDGLMEPLPESAQENRAEIASPVHWVLGLVDVKQGNIDSARSHLKAMEAWQPKRRRNHDSSGLYELLGAIILAEKSYDEVISALKDIRQRKMPWIWNTRYIFGYNMQGSKELLAQAYKEKGDLDKAIEVYEQLTDPNAENRDGRLIYPKNYYYLAQCYEMKGQKARAVRLYEKFLRLWKDADDRLAEVADTRKRLANLR